jgi:hypothetical protein
VVGVLGPAHGNLAIQAVPGESPFRQGMVFAIEKLCFSVRIILTHRECEVYKSARTANYKPVGFIEGALGLGVWMITAREDGRYSPVFPKRILIEEAIQRSLRYRSELVSFPVSREADRE